ncbi:glycoside hydrolase family 28 protein [Pleomorphovibrio marinus]|uniref:glycoside hydrolase family 28 protein n=1 Tax=Pleomorphovibrio marinus TaxID=2164132 RepID=UPI001E5FB50A|nr:glycoside hydrolase family 28 protein [Pleomorphovibrio marinus]
MKTFMNYCSYFFLTLLLSSGLRQGIAQQEGWVDVTQKGVSNEGELSTQAIQGAINELHAKGGGTLYFPSGEYLTGAIELKSNLVVHLDAGAVLKFSTDFDEYLPFVEMRWEGTVMKSFSPLIYANEAENITITGRGTIDGQGQAWWKEMYNIKYPEEPQPLNRYQQLWDEQNPDLESEPYYDGTMNLKFFRPPLIQPFRSKNIRIEGVKIINSPFWTINPAFCENVTITGVTILNPPSPNTDGINPTSCKNVRISDCHISVGDDCITIKSGRDIDGRKWATPTENVTITNCTMLDGHGGVVIGSEVSGDIRKITISNCVFDGTDRGIRLKSARGRGGTVEEIRVDNIVMKNIKDEAIVMNLFYDKGTSEEPVTERTPTFKNIHISNLTATEVNVAGNIVGISEMPIDNISFSNINMEAKKGFEIITASNVSLHHMDISTEEGPSFILREVENILLHDVKARYPLADQPIISLTNGKNILLRHNFPMVDTPAFLKVGGSETEKIYLKDNYFMNVVNPVIEEKDLTPGALNQD